MNPLYPTIPTLNILVVFIVSTASVFLVLNNDLIMNSIKFLKSKRSSVVLISFVKKMDEYPHIQLIYGTIGQHFRNSKTPVEYEEFVRQINRIPGAFDRFALSVNRVFGTRYKLKEEMYRDLQKSYVILLNPVIEHIKRTYGVVYNIEDISKNFAVAIPYTRDIITAYSASRGRGSTEDVQQVLKDSDPESYAVRYPDDKECQWRIQRGERKGNMCGGSAVVVVYKDTPYELDYCKSCILKKARVSNNIREKYPEFDVVQIINKLKLTRMTRKARAKPKRAPKETNTSIDKRSTRILLTPLEEKGYHFLEEIGFVARVNPKTFNLEIIGKLSDKTNISEVKVIHLTDADNAIITQHGYTRASDVTDNEIEKATGLLVSLRSTTYIMNQKDIRQDEETFIRYHTSIIV